MSIHDFKFLGQIEKPSVKGYNQAPGHFDTAVRAAFHYAKKVGKTMWLIPGNSYMNKIWRIVPEGDNTGVKASTPGMPQFSGATVAPDGKVFQVTFKK